MQLTKGFEQAACIIALLATQERKVPLSSQMIHQRINGSQTYLQKLLRRLVVAGLITSVSGNSGGFSLAKDPQQITLLQIVDATEGKIQSYPDLGFIDLVFKDFQPISQEAKQVMNDIFHQADARWCQFLNEQTVYQVISKTLGKKEIPLVDWNNPDVTKSDILPK
ncbi:RrF2 family transcriptional regulator [Liquorilactobacillus capillatus]|uniref:Rrf2 family transcriptional regulator n=1 Tax=Liquorilactobacillus capillatus DSM 19910 TaxID=1423731 RepID=A0A0R1LXK7_9LACO|nr:Rrf2 family transcriptional regulator [Liquorilactobacillus capillatus]KRL00461.1 Rrf2 family transcriptional regulator [Liquorilactobacillus capillatus DSM 19910]